MSGLEERLSPLGSTYRQYGAAAEYFGVERTQRALNRWCDLRRRGHPDESMADLLAVGAVSEDELRACFEEGA